MDIKQIFTVTFAGNDTFYIEDFESFKHNRINFNAFNVFNIILIPTRNSCTNKADLEPIHKNYTYFMTLHVIFIG